MRLSKYIAESGVASRRKAEALIAAGRVQVNGQPALQPWIDVEEGRDRITVDDHPLGLDSKVYILLNKPAGYLSSSSDDRGRRTVMDLIPGIDERLFPVGRLDFDSEGLLLLTNDGQLANRLMHPRYGVDKTYEVVVEGVPSREAIARLEEGVFLEDGMTSPARVRVLGGSRPGSRLEITIHEGRKRQVKRMLAAVGHPVLRLIRIRYAFLELGNLGEGESRLLDQEEVERLYQISEPKK